jgi:predicted transcriptional regulator
MEVPFTPELGAKLTDAAAERGRRPDELVQEVVARYLDADARFAEAVKIGESERERGEYLTHEEVGQQLKRFLERC